MHYVLVFVASSAVRSKVMLGESDNLSRYFDMIVDFSVSTFFLVLICRIYIFMIERACLVIFDSSMNMSPLYTYICPP